MHASTEIELVGLWFNFVRGFLIAIMLEAPILAGFLSARHQVRERIIAAIMLNAVTYPIVALVLPLLLGHTWFYVFAAEIFAPTAECLLFHQVFVDRQYKLAAIFTTLHDFAVITFANVLSFVVGLWIMR